MEVFFVNDYSFIRNMVHCTIVLLSVARHRDQFYVPLGIMPRVQSFASQACLCEFNYRGFTNPVL